MSNSVAINFRAHPDLMRALCQMADDTDRSLSQVLRRAAADYLEANAYDRPMTYPGRNQAVSGLTSKEVESLTGATYRQIYYWVHTGLIAGIEPGGQGVRWRFDEKQVAQVLHVKTMLDAGWSLEGIRESMSRLDKEGNDE